MTQAKPLILNGKMILSLQVKLKRTFICKSAIVLKIVILTI